MQSCADAWDEMRLEVNQPAMGPLSQFILNAGHGMGSRFLQGKDAADRTRYGRTRISTKSFFVHHTQQMAKAAVMYDARAILKRVSVLKQQRLRTGTAAHAAHAGEWA